MTPASWLSAVGWGGKQRGQEEEMAKDGQALLEDVRKPRKDGCKLQPQWWS